MCIYIYIYIYIYIKGDPKRGDPEERPCLGDVMVGSRFWIPLRGGAIPAAQVCCAPALFFTGLTARGLSSMPKFCESIPGARETYRGRNVTLQWHSQKTSTRLCYRVLNHGHPFDIYCLCNKYQ